MLSNLKCQLTHLDPVEEILPNGVAILSTPLGQDGSFISQETSMVKLCECGCGKPAPIAKITKKVWGHIKGVPVRFITGHNSRGKPRPEYIREKIRESKLGERNPRWKGDDATEKSGRQRAVRKYDIAQCEHCGAKATDRHHKDRNTKNNAPDNIQRLCRSCHMIVDGRMEKLILGLARRGPHAKAQVELQLSANG
jgi:5-methylcytosine-specific restriction endonuclease McrA